MGPTLLPRHASVSTDARFYGLLQRSRANGVRAVIDDHARSQDFDATLQMRSPVSFAGEGQGDGPVKNSESHAPQRRALISVPHPAAATAAGFSHRAKPVALFANDAPALI